MTRVERLEALREELRRRGLDGFLVPRTDEHQGEYVPAHAQRLTWLTGFTGSAGMAAVLLEQAAVFVDGRYTLQVRQQVDTGLYQPRHISEEPLGDWLNKALSKGGKLAYDPWLHSDDQISRLSKRVTAGGGELVPVESNPLDAIWVEQPPAPSEPIIPHPLDYAGKASTVKRRELAESLAKQTAKAAVLSLPDSIAWLLNVRGGDVDCTPLPLSFALLEDSGAVQWFVNPAKIGDNVRGHLDDEVSLQDPEAFGGALDGLAGARVMVDPATAPAWIVQRLTAAGAELVKGADPCQLPKAIKNQTELDGTRAAHRRDGAALTRFLAWLDGEGAARAAEGRLTELDLEAKLLNFRKEDPLYRDASFETIAGSGPNGAIVHYRVTPESNRGLVMGELFLLDSGAQYPDGTTDVTRTVAVGTPSVEMRERFTLVLKGHIAIARARFPKGTSGNQLDSLARYPLWLAGLDYDHGTGHGVGSYLGVHEGPQRISKLGQGVALQPGMIVSNEPGYYKEGHYGIRIENLVTVVEAEAESEDQRPMLAFETLTLAPIDRQLVVPALLSPDETAWLDAYHARVRETHLDSLDPEERSWLETATRPIERT